MKWLLHRREKRATTAISEISQFLVNPRVWLHWKRIDIEELPSKEFLGAQLDRIEAHVQRSSELAHEFCEKKLHEWREAKQKIHEEEAH